MKTTQKQIVIDQLNNIGQVSRNWCLQRYITRAAALIATLKKDGYEFDTKTIDSNGRKDYLYIWTNKPSK